MNLSEKIEQDLKDAMKSGDAIRRSTLRLIRSSLHNKKIELGKQEEGLSNEEVIQVLSTEAKKRSEAAEEYSKAGRDEAEANERAEREVIMAYLPEQMSLEDIREEVKKVISETGATGKVDIGKVMAGAMEKLKGKADGTQVREEALKLLS